MSVSNFDQLDALIMLSAKSMIDWEANAFLQTEVTALPNPGFSKRIERLIQRDVKRKSRRPLYKAIKVAAIVCLIALAVLFTACVSIPEIRETIWKAIIEWREDYIHIEFEATGDPSQNTSTETQAPQSAPDNIPKEPITPKKIEAVNPPTYVPYGYTIIADSQKSSYYQEYYTAEGVYVCMFEQALLGQKHWVDNKEAEISEVDINGWNGILIVGEEQLTTVTWQDQYYSYIISGYFENKDEIIKIAKSVRKLP